MVFQECIVEYGSPPGEHLDTIMIFQIMISMVMNFQGNGSSVSSREREQRIIPLEHQRLNYQKRFQFSTYYCIPFKFVLAIIL